MRWITIGAGTLPLRKPGILSSRPSAVAVRWRRDSISSLGTSASRRTRESGSSVTFVLTGIGVDGGGEPMGKDQRASVQPTVDDRDRRS